MPKTYKIGTRGSLLALTQANYVKRELEKNSSALFELEILKTRGDEITNVPLWQLEGKDFFTRELDNALQDGRVDLVCHSHKDLGTERPEGIETLAIPERELPHDVLLVKKSLIGELSTLSQFIVGTSSPRRMNLLENSLSDYLPHQPKVVSKVLRGNVNTRIEKLLEGQYHGIVLALAGIERLLEGGELKSLLKDLTFSILPLSVFPAAAAQGALCIEGHKTNPELKDILKNFHHEETAKAVAKERAIFSSYGGGCHLALGIHYQRKNDYWMKVVKGKVNEENLDDLSLERELPPFPGGKIFIGLPDEKLSLRNLDFEYMGDVFVKKENLPMEQKKFNHLWVSSSYCVDSTDKIEGNLWVAGTQTWRKLSSKNKWVYGASDSLGEESLEGLLKSKLVETLLGHSSVGILAQSNSDYKIGELVPVYRRTKREISKEEKNELSKIKVYYWTSFFQFEQWDQEFTHEAIHCCGMGKTFQKFKENNISVIPFWGMKEFFKWVKS